MKASQWPVDDAVLRACWTRPATPTTRSGPPPDVAVEFVSDAVLTILGRPGTDFAENPELLKETVDPGSLMAVQALLATPAGQTADLDIASRHLDGHVVWTITALGPDAEPTVRSYWKGRRGTSQLSARRSKICGSPGPLPAPGGEHL